MMWLERVHSLPAAHPPQYQDRHPGVLRKVRTIVYDVDRRAGAVLVARRADRLRVSEAAQVLVPRRRADRVLVVQQGAEQMAQEEFGVAADHVLRAGRGPGSKRTSASCRRRAAPPITVRGARSQRSTTRS